MLFIFVHCFIFLLKRSGILSKSGSFDVRSPPPPPASHPSLPTTVTGGGSCKSFLQLGGKNFEKISTVKAGYFGLKLEETMDVQKNKFPALTIPVILVKLTTEIIKNDGM